MLSNSFLIGRLRKAECRMRGASATSPFDVEALQSGCSLIRGQDRLLAIRSLLGTPGEDGVRMG